MNYAALTRSDAQNRPRWRDLDPERYPSTPSGGCVRQFPHDSGRRRASIDRTLLSRYADCSSFFDAPAPPTCPRYQVNPVLLGHPVEYRLSSNSFRPPISWRSLLFAFHNSPGPAAGAGRGLCAHSLVEVFPGVRLGFVVASSGAFPTFSGLSVRHFG